MGIHQSFRPLQLTLSLTAFVFMTSCNDEEKRDPIIHIAANSFTNNNAQVEYWKQMTNTILSNGSHASATDMVVKDGHVYISGLQFTGVSNNAIATLWQDGEVIELTDGSSYASASGVAVSGSDVYVVGVVTTGTVAVATYWKNGQAIAVSPSEGYAFGNDIFVVGDDLYIAGNERINGTGNSIAKYWKNGNAVSLTDGTINSYAYGIAVSGNNVHVYGKQRDDEGNEKPIYWKNESATFLDEGIMITDISDIVINGNDVYLVGTAYPDVIDHGTFLEFGKGIVKYWKNGQSANVTDGTKDAFGGGIFVTGNDIYIVGSEEGESGISILTYWKNGSAVALTDGTVQSRGVAITIDN